MAHMEKRGQIFVLNRLGRGNPTEQERGDAGKEKGGPTKKGGWRNTM